MFNLYYKNGIVFTGSHSECLLWLEKYAQIESQGVYTFYTRDDINKGGEASFKMVRIN